MSRRLVLFFALATGCGESEPSRTLPVSNGMGPAPYDPGVKYAPRVTPEELSTTVDNPLFPAPVGASWTYEARTDEGLERDEVTVLAETKDVWGVTATVVRDTVYLDDELIEDTWDWYAQDTHGNVWYLGEETYEYEDGVKVCDCGSWQSGVGGALPGVIMLGDPRVGDVYRQEYLAGEAEDLAEVVSLDETVTVPAGTFEGCIETHDLSAVEASVDEHKFHCPGVGTVLELEGDVRVELIAYSVP
jgi:hypothetical protein